MERQAFQDEKTSLLPQTAHHQPHQKRRHAVKSVAITVLLFGW
jgi:hypothetical protein